jgi:hypothetical protein
VATQNKNFKVKNGLDAEGAITATGNVSGNYLLATNSSGDEGGEILLSKPVTNTTIAGTGITIDVFQNKLRFFEQGGSARGYYIDLTSGGNSASTNLASGASVPLTLTALSTGFSIAGGTTSKTLTVSNTITLAGTDSSTLNIGTGGTLGTGAFATIANYAPLAGATFTGQIQSTLANSTTTGGGQIYLNGATGNRIDFNTNGVGAPAFTTRSAGTKIVLYPNISGSTVDYAIGVDNSTLWQSVLNSTGSFKWYAGTTQVASLSGAGLFTAVSKSFDIQHPTNPDMRLRYGSLEGPENGVYVRGVTKENVIELPEYWTGLVDESTITATISSVGKFQKVYVEKIEGNKVYIGGRVKEISYVVFGERKDIDKITVEY